MSLRVIRPSDRVKDTASGAMGREAAISAGLTGSRLLWMGYVELAPGTRSAHHHHGESESAIYIISGRARFLTGDRLEEAHDASQGDFVWVPPHLRHVEMNLSGDEPVRMVVARSTQEAIVVNLPDPDEMEVAP
ncbi:MAG: cupin domain-containing protein [Actinomycetota bacterium]